jgi:membrane associated rhomboid family serine protease
MLIVGSSAIDSSKIPFVTIMLLVATIAFFIKGYCLEVIVYNDLSGTGFGESRSARVESIKEFYNFWGFQISDFKRGEYHSIFSNIFMHAGFWHMFGNMMAFWAFALALEEFFGSVSFLVFYLGTGVVACVSQGLFLTGSDIPIVGASGAVAAMMGAYAILFGMGAHVKILIWFFGPRIVNVPAPAFAAFWVFPQLIDLSENGVSDGGGVALISHVAGFALGAVVGLVMKPEANRRITQDCNGTMKIKTKEKDATKSEKEILDQILAMRPFAEVVETIGDSVIECPKCEFPLDLHNSVSERLVKCTNPGCTKMTYIDGELLASHL